MKDLRKTNLRLEEDKRQMTDGRCVGKVKS